MLSQENVLTLKYLEVLRPRAYEELLKMMEKSILKPSSFPSFQGDTRPLHLREKKIDFLFSWAASDKGHDFWSVAYGRIDKYVVNSQVKAKTRIENGHTIYSLKDKCFLEKKNELYLSTNGDGAIYSPVHIVQEYKHFLFLDYAMTYLIKKGEA